MTRQVRIITVPAEYLAEFFRGEAVLLNMPADGKTLGWAQHKKDCGVMVHSATYPICSGPLQVTVGVVQRIKRDAKVAA